MTSQIKTPSGIGRRFDSRVQRSCEDNLHENSGLVTGVEAVELAQQRRPHQPGRAQFGAVGVRLHHHGVLVDHGLFDRIGCRSEHAGAHLHGAGGFQMEHALEGRGHRTADRQRAVIASSMRFLPPRSASSRWRSSWSSAMPHSVIGDPGYEQRDLVSGSRPSVQRTASPAGACRWITQPASSRAACMALWIVKPAGLTG